MTTSVTKVVTDASSYSFLSLTEARGIMGGLVTSASDAQLQAWIDASSDYIAIRCNRVFGYEKVIDTFRDVNADSGPRMWLNRWPAAVADITAIQVNGSDITATTDQWELAEREEGFGKLSIFQSLAEPITVSYSGGYKLPTEAPPALKNACVLLVRNAQIQMTAIASTGIRQLSHGNSRVTFFDPAAFAKAQLAGAGTQQAIEALLVHYRRIEC
jgi:hypothetical protein